MLIRDNTIPSLNNNNIEEHAGIKFQEIPFVKKINLRGNPKDKKFISLCHKILDIILPTESNTYIKNKKIKVIWLGPNEWLIVDENQNDENNLLTRLQSVILDQDTSVTDVSENRTIIRVSGDKLFILLAKYFSLDLNNILLKQQSVAQTLFVKVPVLIVRINIDNKIPMLDIFTNRSHANYIYNHLIDGTKNLHF